MATERDEQTLPEYYVKDIRLTREGEVEVAKRIESAQNELRDTILKSQLLLPALADLSVGYHEEMSVYFALPWPRDEEEGLLLKLVSEVSKMEAERIEIISSGRDRTKARRIRKEQIKLMSGIRVNDRFWKKTIKDLEECYSVMSRSVGRPSKYADRISRSATGIGFKKLAELIVEMERLSRISRSAINELIEANVKLSFLSVVRRFVGTSYVYDNVQEGNLGLIRAAEKFDYRKGYKFSTYGLNWINQAVHRASCQLHREIKIPSNAYILMYKAKKAKGEFYALKNRRPTTKELAKKMNLTNKRMQAILDIPSEFSSLDVGVGDSESPRINLLKDSKSERQDDRAVRLENAERVEHIMKFLTDRERFVIRKRFGFDKEGQLTLREIGEALGVSRERIRQIEAEAIGKLQRLEGIPVPPKSCRPRGMYGTE